MIIALGLNAEDVEVMRRVASEFGWLVGNQRYEPTPAVFVTREFFGLGTSWKEVVRRVRQVSPSARIVACHGFRDAVEPEELGIFHSLHLPFNEVELRQSLGFVWEAERREALKVPPVLAAAHEPRNRWPEASETRTLSFTTH